MVTRFIRLLIQPMATHSKIADNEMNYFQFKARQMLLLTREDQEWQELCKQVAPTCVAENVNLKESKDIGIQANSRPSFKKFERPSLQSVKQNEQIPDALNNIKARLERIDLALSKIYDMPEENEKRKKHEVTSALKNTASLKNFEEERRFNQTSLKTNLEKLQSFPQKVIKKPTIKPKNSSYFLPHDLQIKRAAARKAYLASLQTKPKVSFQKIRQISKKSAQSNQNIKDVSKHSPKSKKKVVTTKTKPPNEEKETLIASFEVDESKDENIEFVVDAILEDLLQEAGLDLNRIKERKGEFNTLKQKTLEKVADITSSSLTSSPIKHTEPKSLAYDNSSITRQFSNSSTKPYQGENEQKKLLLETTRKKTSVLQSEYQKYVPGTSMNDRNDTDIFQPKQFSRIKDPPKFVCNVLHSITINPEKAKDIIQNKERYWRYLKNISRTIKGNFNPWILNSMLAESILDDCINDIAEELSDVPSTFIQELYNQEFIQQVEK